MLELRVFGSYARGDYRAGSDVDVLVVLGGDVPDRERREIFDLAFEAYEESLVRVAPFVCSEAEWATLRQRELLIATEIEREGIPL